MKLNSLKTKTIFLVSSILIVVCVGLGSISYYNASSSLKKTVNEMLSKLAVEASYIIEAKTSNQFFSLESIAANEKILSLNNGQTSGKSLSEVIALLDQEVKRLDHKELAIIDTSGNAIYNNGRTENLSDRNYFQKALNGSRALSNPFVSDIYNSLVITYAVPIKNNNQVVGVLAATRDGYELSEFAREISVGKTGNSFIANSVGKTIAHSDINVLNSLIGLKSGQTDAVSSATATADSATDADAVSSATVESNNLTSAQERIGFKNYDVVKKQMQEGKTGFAEYEYSGTEMYLGFAPIQSLGWSIAVQAEKSEMLSGIQNLRRSSIIVSMLFLIISLALSYLYSIKLINRIKTLRNYSMYLGEYDLSKDISPELLNLEDEIGDLAKSFLSFTQKIRSMIIDVKSSVSKTSNAIRNISAATEITGKAAEQIAVSSSEVANSTVKQSRYVETIVNLSNKNKDEVIKGFEITENALEEAKRSTSGAEAGKESIFKSIGQLMDVRENMEIATKSVQSLEHRSEQIGRIVTIITNIASQTNLLALNAAIEAARAGETGKGFSVVAEEIQKLAEESEKSAKEIKQLIADIQKETIWAVKTMENNMGNLNLQMEHLQVQGETLEAIVQMVKNTEQRVENLYATLASIQTSSSEILNTVVDISGSLEETAAFSQQVAATTEEQYSASEEVAAIADELSTIATNLQEKIEVFKTDL
ncbi:MAG: hypothetical protein GYA02_00950 [Clostridiaceae bacterium]|jgi:methyl-accepting chemotaxis protein|nr:hypothetical protein [Clostridiaceae bacterium]